jgi:ribose 5-phosphate isomerase A
VVKDGRMGDDPILRTLALRALAFVPDDATVGLGSGRAALAFVRALGERVQQGLRVRGVPTSEATAAAARLSGIPLIGLDLVADITVTIDGADEVAPTLDLIKGYGGALVREKIVAAASQREIILVGREKLVPVLGARGIVPVEVVPFGAPFCARRITALGWHANVRRVRDAPFVSDGGNYILDCGVGPLTDPQRFETAVRAIPGVIDTGLFLGIADCVLVGDETGVRELRRPG